MIAIENLIRPNQGLLPGAKTGPQPGLKKRRAVLR